MRKNSGPQYRTVLPRLTIFAGHVGCLRCERIFLSKDRRHVRICPKCKVNLLTSGASALSEDFLYATPWEDRHAKET